MEEKSNLAVMAPNSESPENDIIFAEEYENKDSEEEASRPDPWKILIVDDDEEVHHITRLALKKLTFQGRSIRFLNAFSGREAAAVLREHPDIAVILLDVVMETEQSGLELVRYIRNDLKNPFVRVILRTGHPGEAPERKIITEYDINDYKEKTELTAKKLFTSVTASLRSYRDLSIIEENRKKLDKYIRDLREEIRERKKLEEALLHSQKMQAIGTLAGGIAHDFNNILMTIMMNTEYSLKKVKNDETIHESLGLVMKAAGRAKDLVEQILTFSRKKEHKQRPVDIILIVRETLKMLRSSIPTTISIETDIRCEKAVVSADPIRIQQILINLCSNSAHAIGKTGGRILVSLYETETFPDGMTAGPSWVLSVKDTGKGIPPDIRDRIFEPFFTTKKPGEGTGMGLAVVHGIVTAMGGRIRFRSDPGKETVFDIILPKIEMAEPERKIAVNDPIGGKGNVFVVDDEPDIVRTLEKTLTDAGFQVAGAVGSRVALEYFKAEGVHFDILVTDQTMPEMTGIDLASEVRKIRPEIPVVVMSGYDEVIQTGKTGSTGRLWTVRKPLDTRELTGVINDILLKKGNGAPSNNASRFEKK